MNNNPLQINLKNKLIDLSSPIVMGIVNVTPDSFFKGNRFMSEKAIIQCVEKIIIDGGSIIDVGGYSTRPTADVVSQDEEIKRVSRAIECILKRYPDIFISVDTFRSSVARHVVRNFEVAMINDISGGTLDSLMFETIADLQVAYVLMHTKGTPQTMQNQTLYEDLVSDVLQFLEKRLARLHLFGANDVIIDVGFGFAKTASQNFLLLNKLSYFKELKAPILVGVSRKSMIYNTLDINAEDALNGTTACNMLALMGGANILRVHDVKEAIQAIKIYNEFNKGGQL
jgi:dihydropteroate synthase